MAVEGGERTKLVTIQTCMFSFLCEIRQSGGPSRGSWCRGDGGIWAQGSARRKLSTEVYMGDWVTFFGALFSVDSAFCVIM